MFKKYLKMLIPRFGTFTNGAYDIEGCIWLGRLKGICRRTEWINVCKIGEYRNWPEYNLIKDLKPQFYRK